MNYLIHNLLFVILVQILIYFLYLLSLQLHLTHLVIQDDKNQLMFQLWQYNTNFNLLELLLTSLFIILNPDTANDFVQYIPINLVVLVPLFFFNSTTCRHFTNKHVLHHVIHKTDLSGCTTCHKSIYFPSII